MKAKYEIEFEVTEAQHKAYEALPEEVRKNLRPPRGGNLIMTDEEIEGLQSGKLPTSTIMCPW